MRFGTNAGSTSTAAFYLTSGQPSDGESYGAGVFPGHLTIGDSNSVTNNGRLSVIDTTRPLVLGYSTTKYVNFDVSSSGDFTIDAMDDIRLDAGGGDIVLRDDGSEFGRLSNSSQDLIINQTQNDKDIIFQVYDNSTTTEVMRIDGSESRVGIGTTSPDYKFDVRHAGYNVALISGQSNGNYPVLHVKDSTDTATAWFEGNRAGDQSSRIALWHNPASSHGGSHTAIMFQMNDDGDNKTNYAQIRSGIDVITGGSEGGNLAFYTSQAGSLTEQMRIPVA